MRDELTQAELDEIFYGPPPKVVARFFDKEVLDPAASRAAGCRVNKTSTYVELECVKEEAKNIRPMSVQDKKLFPQAWAEYQREKDIESGLREAGVSEADEAIPIGAALLKAQGQA